MKINIPIDVSTLMLNGSNAQPGKNGQGKSFAKLLQASTGANVDLHSVSQQEDSLRLPEEVMASQLPSLHREHAEQLIVPVNEPEGWQDLRSLAVYQAVVGDELANQLTATTPVTTVQLASPTAQVAESVSVERSALVEPHVQRAFANHVLAHRRDLATTHDRVIETKVSFTPSDSENQSSDVMMQKEMGVINRVSLNQEAWPQANRAMETSSSAAKAHEELDSLTAIQQLLQEYQLFLRKQIIVSKNDERLFVYVRDYDASTAELDQQLNALKNVLQKKFKLPVNVVVNGSPQIADQIIFNKGEQHAS